MPRFRKKPVEIDAMQHHTGSDVSDVIDWILANGGTARWHDDGNRIAIDTLEGTMSADVGDWIIRGVKGEFYPCKPDIFDATYESLEESSTCSGCGARTSLDGRCAKCRHYDLFGPPYSRHHHGFVP